MAQITGGQILTFQISEFPIDVDQVSKYGVARGIPFCVL